MMRTGRRIGGAGVDGSGRRTCGFLLRHAIIIRGDSSEDHRVISPTNSVPSITMVTLRSKNVRTASIVDGRLQGLERSVMPFSPVPERKPTQFGDPNQKSDSSRRPKV